MLLEDAKVPEVNGIHVPFLPAGGVEELRRKPKTPFQPDKTQTSFKEIFEREVQELKFSAHAQTRIGSREIPLSGSELKKLESAVSKAEAKGARESLILMDDMAFIVSIRNRTVITAVNSDQLKENVFTNIDSAVIA